MEFKHAQQDPRLRTRLERELARAGHANATVEIADCEGFALCTVGGLELEPEQVATLVRCLRLIGYSNSKLFKALGIIEEYAK